LAKLLKGSLKIPNLVLQVGAGLDIRRLIEERIIQLGAHDSTFILERLDFGLQLVKTGSDVLLGCQGGKAMPGEPNHFGDRCGFDGRSRSQDIADQRAEGEVRLGFGCNAWRTFGLCKLATARVDGRLGENRNLKSSGLVSKGRCSDGIRQDSLRCSELADEQIRLTALQHPIDPTDASGKRLLDQVAPGDPPEHAAQLPRFVAGNPPGAKDSVPACIELVRRICLGQKGPYRSGRHRVRRTNSVCKQDRRRRIQDVATSEANGLRKETVDS